MGIPFLWSWPQNCCVKMVSRDFLFYTVSAELHLVARRRGLRQEAAAWN